MTSSRPPWRITPGTVAIVITLVTFLAVVIAISSRVASEDDRTSHEPIVITGDEEMDAFPDWARGDGLTADTAYVLEGFRIDGIGEGAIISE